jgi:hypothetical protein
MRIVSAADGFVLRIEKRTGLFATAVFIGMLLLLLSMMFSATRFETFHHGNAFTRLSEHPFGHDNPNDLRLRILSPLLGYILFFRGPAFKYFMLIILAVFLGMIYFFSRKKDLSPVEAFGVAAVCTFTTLTFYQLYFPAYTDPTSFLLILILMFSFRKPFAAVILLMLMLFNHEQNIFLMPFFFFLMLDKNYSLRNILIITVRFILAAIPYFLYRTYILSNESIDYSTSYYFDPGNMQWTKEHVLPNLISGIFQSFRLGWGLIFVALLIDVFKKNINEIVLISLVLIFVSSQLLIAHDISRLMGLAFPALLIAAFRLKKYFSKKYFILIIYFVLLINFFIPSYYVGALGPTSLSPSWFISQTSNQ